MDTVDKAIAWILLLFTTVSIVLLVIPLPTVHEITGDIFVILTHAMIIPVFILFCKDPWYRKNGQWYIAILSNSLAASVLYHVCKLADVLQRETTHWDISSQNLLLLATLLILVDEDNVPSPLGYISISMCAIFVASFGEATLFGLKIFEWVAGIIFIVLFGYVFKRSCSAVPGRNNSYLYVASCLVVAAGFTFVLSTSTIKGSLHEDVTKSLDDKYGLIHSMWHVYAYSMLYFTLKAIGVHPGRRARATI
jgi:hypothetical protein